MSKNRVSRARVPRLLIVVRRCHPWSSTPRAFAVTEPMLHTTEALLAILQGTRRGALATVVRTSGSTPQWVGARILLCPDDQIVGTVGGGAIEKQVLEKLYEVRDGAPASCTQYNLGYDLGMCCGGSMEVFIEPVIPPPKLLIFGAGHVAQPTATTAKQAGFRVTVVDDREEWLTPDRFPECQHILDTPRSALSKMTLTSSDWILIMTHDHAIDEYILEHTAQQPHRYIGLIGSRRKVLRILQRVQMRSHLPSLDRIYAPVGVDIGAQMPEEIAVSIVAELIAIRRGRSQPHHMRMETRPTAAVT